MTEFENLSPKDLKRIKKTAELYRKRFGDDLWQEVSKCPDEKCRDASGINFYGPKNQPGTKCPCCGSKLIEAYPIIETTRYIRDEISRTNAVAKIVPKNEEPVAFGWGYQENGAEFSEKYREPNREYVANIVGKDKEVIYLSEFAVAREEEGKKIGTEIVNEVIETAKPLKKPFLLRTMKSKPEKVSPMDLIAQKLGMKPIMGSEDTPPDPEDSGRILYYKE